MYEIDAAHRAFAEAVGAFLDSSQIYTDFLSRFAYGTDASFYRYVPQVVVRAHTEAEIIQLFQAAKVHRVGLTFRASGTSLSGQTSAKSVLVLMGDSFFSWNILNQGEQIELGPMVIGARANGYLKPYGVKIGPDPASINTARIGGILSNNSSGMCCGTKDNSYHTLADLRVVLTDGTVLDTKDPESVAAFRKSHETFLAELTELAEQIKHDPKLSERVRHKYRLKNTTGYGVNSLLDYDDPIDILKHLLVGAEGTLGFVSEVTYNTVPDYENRASAFLYFESLADCCSAVAGIKAGAIVDAVELIDGKSIQFVGNVTRDLPPFFYNELNEDSACLLIETKAETAAALDEQIAVIDEIAKAYHYSYHTGFQKDPAITEHYWNVRKGLLPIVSKGRPEGTNVITEDVVFPMEKMVDGVRRLTELFKEYEYPEAMIMGHALEGNLHFVLVQKMSDDAAAKRFDAFLNAVADLVAVELGGSLKGEHGTGRNIAPFVEREWGEEIYEIMRRIKKLFDPNGILNPDVLITDNKNIHIESIKAIPQTDDLINDCMECGFCEPACPSDGYTLTPRQRISAYRNMEGLPEIQNNPAFYNEMKALYQFKGIESCAETGMCALRCPVGINTGAFMHALRGENPSKLQDMAQRHFSKVEKGARLAVGAVQALGVNRIANLTESLHGKFEEIPIIPKSLPHRVTDFNQTREITARDGAEHKKGKQVVYFVSCVNRSLSEVGSGTSTFTHTVNLFKKAGITPIIVGDGLCCGQPFESKCNHQVADQATLSLNRELLRASNKGEITIYIDNAPCAKRIFEAKKRGFLDDHLKLYDAVSYIDSHIVPNLTITPKSEALLLHVPCSITAIGEKEALTRIAGRCTDQLVMSDIDCCGFAGDKGFKQPELNRNSLRHLPLKSDGCASGVSASKTCQIGLTETSGLPFASIEALLDECSEAKKG